MSFITTTRAVTRALTAASPCAAIAAPAHAAVLLGGTRVILNEKTGKRRSR